MNQTKKYINDFILSHIMKNNIIIRKVWLFRNRNQKMITIPKDSDINEGDYVKIKKVENESI